MATPELLILSILRALTEVALLTLLGQGLLALLAGSRRATNPVYRVFQVITGPVIRAVRFITPKQIIDGHLPFVTFFLLFWLWIFLAYAKQLVCDLNGLNCLGG
ncbi:MAG: hypothetical protein D4S02_18660 [Rhodocyclaceae bacterium]|nr:MAG: hypothetical protein D4S02_18660 [Rhodocyclaceae bacterium]